MSWRYVTHRQLEQAFHELVELINERTANMATQADIDAITAQLGQVSTDLATAKSTLQTEIDNLAQTNPSLDISALQAAAAPLDAAVQAVGALVPDQPAPPAPPAA